MPPTATVLELETPQGLARATSIPPPRRRPPRWCSATAPAARSTPPTSRRSPRQRARPGLAVALVEQPYRVAGRRSPPAAPAPRRGVDRRDRQLRERAAELPLMLGGRSSGARVACRTAQALGAARGDLRRLPAPPAAPLARPRRSRRAWTSSTPRASPRSSSRAPATPSACRRRARTGRSSPSRARTRSPAASPPSPRPCATGCRACSSPLSNAAPPLPPPSPQGAPHAQQDHQDGAGRRRGRAHRPGRRGREAERPLEGVRPDAQQGALHRPHAHDHAGPAGLEGLRARDLRAQHQPAHRPALHLRGRRLRGDGVHALDRPVRHAVRPAGALGARAGRDRRGPRELLRPSARRHQHRAPGGRRTRSTSSPSPTSAPSSAGTAASRPARS